MNQPYNPNPTGSQMPPVPPQNMYPPQTPQQPEKKRRGLLIAAIVIGLLLIGGGVAAFFLLRNNNASSSGGETSTTVLADSSKTDEPKADTLNGKGLSDTKDDEPSSVGKEDGSDDLLAKEGNEGSDGGFGTAGGDDDADVQQVKQRLNRFQYSMYHNDRFNFNVNVPDFMAPGPPSQNGDGCKFYYNGITLSAYASHNALETDVVQELNRRDADATRHYLDSRSFRISGKDESGNLYEEKAVLKNDVWYTVELNYPAKYKPVIGPLSQIVTNFEP